MSPAAVSPLDAVEDSAAFGGKAAGLGAAVRAGLPVPAGVAVSWPLVHALAAGDRGARAALAPAAALGAFVAVRSSGVGEDAADASFAGQHRSLLNVPAAEVAEAVAAVGRSVRSAPALAYRRRMGASGEPRAGAVVQRMVDADVAGVAFRPNPVTRADEVVVEAAWGLGEAVVSGLVVPDHYRLRPSGGVLERRPGTKDRVVVCCPGGGTAEEDVAADRAAAACLDDGQLDRLRRLTGACHGVFGGSQDLEWAFAAGELWLLQRRPVTGAGPTPSERHGTP